LKVVLLCRYLEQIDAVKKEPLEGVIVPSRTVDGASLLSFSKAFVGYGGTMTTEAALLGTYTISSYPGPNTYVEDYLVQENLVVREADQGKIPSLLLGGLDEAVEEERRQKAKKLLEAMVNPVDLIVKTISKMEKGQPSA
jgi:predicted glycosyltransferase